MKNPRMTERNFESILAKSEREVEKEKQLANLGFEIMEDTITKHGVVFYRPTIPHMMVIQRTVLQSTFAVGSDLNFCLAEALMHNSTEILKKLRHVCNSSDACDAIEFFIKKGFAPEEIKAIAEWGVTPLQERIDATTSEEGEGHPTGGQASLTQ